MGCSACAPVCSTKTHTAATSKWCAVFEVAEDVPACTCDRGTKNDSGNKNGCGPEIRSPIMLWSIECIRVCLCSKRIIRQGRPQLSAAHTFLQRRESRFGAGCCISVNQSFGSCLIDDLCQLTKRRFGIVPRRRFGHQRPKFLQFGTQSRPLLTIQQSSSLILTQRLFCRKRGRHNKLYHLNGCHRFHL